MTGSGDDLPGGLERIDCVECGKGVITNHDTDDVQCVGCSDD